MEVDLVDWSSAPVGGWDTNESSNILADYERKIRSKSFRSYS